MHFVSQFGPKLIAHPLGAAATPSIVSGTMLGSPASTLPHRFPSSGLYPVYAMHDDTESTIEASKPGQSSIIRPPPSTAPASRAVISVNFTLSMAMSPFQYPAGDARNNNLLCNVASVCIYNVTCFQSE